MLRVALFIDGKNFYRSLCQFDSQVEIDYDRLAAWVCGFVAGGAPWRFTGAQYYTAHHVDTSVGGVKFTSFLRALEYRTGFFVRREPSVQRETRCPSCDAVTRYRTEKRVDTRLVADMVRMAAIGAFDIAVLMSGDQDLIPAVEAAHDSGRQVWVAHWSRRGLSPELRVRCFGEIDLARGVSEFRTTRGRPTAASAPETEPLGSETVAAHDALLDGAESDGEHEGDDDADARAALEAEVGTPPHEHAHAPAHDPCAPAPSPAMPAATPISGSTSGPVDPRVVAAEVGRAIEFFQPRGLYLSRWYFENKWTATGAIPPLGTAERRAAVQAAVEAGFVQVVPVQNKKGRPDTALAVVAGATAASEAAR